MIPGGLRWQAEAVLPQGLSAREGRLDAYLVWDLLSGFQRHAGPADTAAPSAERWLPLVAELAAPPAEVLATMAGADAATSLPALAALLGRWAGPAGLSAIQTGIVPEALIPVLARAVADGRLLRFQLGAPCARPLPAPLQPSPGLPTGLLESLPDGQLHTLGIIDDGCCLAHQDFRNAQGQSRLLWLWDQTPDAAAGAHWRRHGPLQAGLGLAPAYGMELSQPRINALLQDARTGQLGEAGERALYAALDRPGWGPPDHSHGARVMHLMAGPAPPPPAPTGPLAQGYKPPPYPEPAAVSAASLPIIFVQLPAQTIADTSGDSLALHVIDGARYIVGRSRDAAPAKAGWLSTLNISLGGIAGPHDGSSLAEQALDELAADARVRVVVSAGNAADRQRVHAQRSVSRQAPGDFFIDLPAGQAQHSFIECWLPDAGAAAEAWQISVTPPGAGAPAALVAAGEVASLRTASGTAVACLVFARQVAQGLHGTMALLALAPTAPPQPASPVAPAGLWQLQLRCSAETAVEVHAWVERDDVLVGRRQPQRTRFEFDARQPRDAQYVNDRCTLSTLAQGQAVIAVGATVQSSNAIAPYSSQGPCRGLPLRDPVLHYAPGDRSPSQPGVLVAGFYSGQVAAIAGTSAAAPQVARRLVETGSALAPDAGSMTDPDGRPLAPAA